MRFHSALLVYCFGRVGALHLQKRIVDSNVCSLSIDELSYIEPMNFRLTACYDPFRGLESACMSLCNCRHAMNENVTLCTKSLSNQKCQFIKCGSNDPTRTQRDLIDVNDDSGSQSTSKSEIPWVCVVIIVSVLFLCTVLYFVHNWLRNGPIRGDNHEAIEHARASMIYEELQPDTKPKGCDQDRQSISTTNTRLDGNVSVISGLSGKPHHDLGHSVLTREHLTTPIYDDLVSSDVRMSKERTSMETPLYNKLRASMDSRFSIKDTPVRASVECETPKESGRSSLHDVYDIKQQCPRFQKVFMWSRKTSIEV
uniref:AlNc14C229G9263 protein n=1 Tax=Albugo laibachii Nc14 TaxID=890382 RepID=F0WSC3_9STRA|nr:AlNc14C229G9263 [Albugo laibachii Nc14]CCA25880.1 AlNc14C329G10667 [Albugo laibachii Nc14]|eukprot:CCA25880.1 AlNc14C329G10667 [Albugo laibachii Nc14]